MTSRRHLTLPPLPPSARAVLLVLLLIVGLGIADPARAEDGFVEGFTDLPLMTGMAQIPDATVAFDTAGGRIVIAFARTAAKAADVRAFYRSTLAQLGWVAAGPDRFRRETESLTLDFTPDGAETIVRFSLLPQ